MTFEKPDKFRFDALPVAKKEVYLLSSMKKKM